MQSAFLLFATVLMWIAVIVGLYQRIFEMPKWFADPPASFGLIRKQSKSARAFWIPLSALFMVSLGIALILNWENTIVRKYIFATLACYGTTGLLSGIYFVKEVIAFTKIPAHAPKSESLMQRVKFWLRWTSVRDVLQILAGVFVTIAYTHI